MRVLVLALVLAACKAEISGNDLDGGGGGADADDIDAPPSSDAPLCFNGRVVYLNFDGQTLTQGASDAIQNRASWMTIATGTAPAYRAADANRQATITAITNGVTTALSAFPISVVTQRPAQGQYVMIVFGGTAGNVGSNFGGAVQALDCGDAVRNDVAWVSDGVTPDQRVINFALGAIGFGLGLTATTDPNDCMCGWDNVCTQSITATCTFSSGIARDPQANQLCLGLTTQNELQALTQAFCQ